MVLASSGEASDGHILSIRGGTVPEQMPLLISHENDPRSHLGSIVDAKKSTDGGLEVLRATGVIEMGGSGAVADVRRDVAHMIASGHLRGVSISWEPTAFVERTSLSADHPAYVSPNDPDLRKRWGLFVSKWRALEGSVVSVGADPAALIGRSNETTGDVAAFWRSMAIATSESGRSVPIEEHEAVRAALAAAEARIASLVRSAEPRVGPVRDAGNDDRVMDAVKRGLSNFDAEREAIRAFVRKWVRENLGRIS